MALVKGQPVAAGELAWFTVANGQKVNAEVAQYQILDMSAGEPGVVVFPITGIGFQNASFPPAQYNLGAYYPHDGDNPYTPQEIGPHRIVWQWKINLGDAFQQMQEDFVVLPPEVKGAPLYVDIDDIRKAGLPTGAVDDDTVLEAIQTWQEFIERACRQWFYARTMDFKFDGTDSDTACFAFPVISVSALYVNDSTTALDASRYRVYSNKNGAIDDRRNPRICIVAFEDQRDIFSDPVVLPNTRLRFFKGRQNQRLVGSFGFVEDDGGPPKLIKRALTKLVIEKLASPMVLAGAGSEIPLPPLVAGLIQREVTDLHQLDYQQQPFRPRGVGLTGITKDQEILDIIRMYRAPIGISTPQHRSASS